MVVGQNLFGESLEAVPPKASKLARDKKGKVAFEPPNRNLWVYHCISYGDGDTLVNKD